jgi:hypothetical protein
MASRATADQSSGSSSSSSGIFTTISAIPTTKDESGPWWLNNFTAEVPNGFCIQNSFDLNRVSDADRQSNPASEKGERGAVFGNGGDRWLFSGAVSNAGGVTGG